LKTCRISICQKVNFFVEIESGISQRIFPFMSLSLTKENQFVHSSHYRDHHFFWYRDFWTTLHIRKTGRCADYTVYNHSYSTIVWISVSIFLNIVKISHYKWTMFEFYSSYLSAYPESNVRCISNETNVEVSCIWREGFRNLILLLLDRAKSQLQNACFAKTFKAS
jgi:hypothetical protein